MGCGVYWQQINTIERGLRDLRRLGIGEGTDAFRGLTRLRGELLARVGFKFPRIPLPVLRLPGLSPGEISVKFDPEFGWFSMARERPGAAPVYKRIDAETAALILKGELTKELEERLMATETYVGE